MTDRIVKSNMQLRQEHLPFLTGQKFSSGLAVNFEITPDDKILHDRIHWLQEQCRGKRIIHLGCVDHNVAMIDMKRKKGRWLHGCLDDVADRCYGVDLDADGIEYMRQVGYPDVKAVDIVAASDPEIMTQQWDALVVAEVLEHIGDPVAFLRAIKNRYAGSIDEMILTVPNAFSYEITRMAWRGRELINSDHRYWFTPYTISKVMTEAGFRIEKIAMLSYRVRRTPWKRWFYRNHPLLRQNIGVRVKLDSTA